MSFEKVFGVCSCAIVTPFISDGNDIDAEAFSKVVEHVSLGLNENGSIIVAG
jgi:dihydrodipicolinate synthase/N-acetylneuraminate lyase